MLEYRHQYLNSKSTALPTGKIVCVGRNYAAHAKELNNPIPKQPIIFIKPSTAAVSFLEPIEIPVTDSNCHYEAEIAVLIGERLKNSNAEQIQSAIVGYGLGLDLTLRQLQAELKQQGHPWELAKGFDGACPLTPFVEAKEIQQPNFLGLKNIVNQNVEQWGHVNEMLNPIVDLIQFIIRSITLLPGDVVLTGTPAGVGVLNSGDELALELLLFDGEKKTNQSKILASYKSRVASDD